MSTGIRRAKTRRPALDLVADRARSAVGPTPYFAWQGARCRLAGLALLLPALPLIGLLALLVKLTSRGPGIFRQTRVGLAGRTYTMYKLRTMRVDAEAGTGAVWTAENDPRVTRLGRFLRAVHLDEFPQLFNVVKGEMALVGPRPERPEFTHRLAREIPRYLERLAVRPGITGLAQVNLPPDTDLDSVRRKLALDLEYVERGSLSMDLRIFAVTFLRLFHIPTDLLLRAVRLRRNAMASGGREPPVISVSGNGQASGGHKPPVGIAVQDNGQASGGRQPPVGIAVQDNGQASGGRQPPVIGVTANGQASGGHKPPVGIAVQDNGQASGGRQPPVIGVSGNGQASGGREPPVDNPMASGGHKPPVDNPMASGGRQPPVENPHHNCDAATTPPTRTNEHDVAAVLGLAPSAANGHAGNAHAGNGHAANAHTRHGQAGNGHAAAQDDAADSARRPLPR